MYSRSERVLDQLAEHRRSTEKEYVYAGDAVLHRVFGLPVTRAADGRLLVFGGPPAVRLWTLAPQHFPFLDQGSGAQQYVLWHSTPERDVAGAERLVSKLFSSTPHKWFVHEPDCCECFCVQIVTY